MVIWNLNAWISLEGYKTAMKIYEINTSICLKINKYILDLNKKKKIKKALTVKIFLNSEASKFSTATCCDFLRYLYINSMKINQEPLLKRTALCALNKVQPVSNMYVLLLLKPIGIKRNHSLISDA